MSLRAFKAILLPLCTACLLLALWMVFHSLSGVQMAGCGAGSACDDVMGSPWAWMLGGVPVSLPAAALYALLLLCVLFLDPDPARHSRPDRESLDPLLWRLMPLLAGCIVGAALWFGYLQLFVLHRFCKYCTLLHALGCVASVLILCKGARPGLFFVPGLAAAAIFAFVQARTLPDTVYDAGRSDADLPAFSDGEVPVISSEVEKSPVTLTLLFDFQCSHCRRLHRILPELLDLAEGEYRIQLCPVPLSSACNPYIPASGIDRFAGSCQLTRLALAVWYARPDLAPDYWDWLLGDGESPVSPETAEARARELLGADSLAAALADPRIGDYLRKVEELFGRSSSPSRSGVPRLILGQRWLVPETDDPAALLSLLREQL